ncbi:MAG: hypothetical protein GC182_06045 [Rhodopseudomonas sp.]|nr:hypothetical protein [Rhodopseudomonas sp.]
MLPRSARFFQSHHFPVFSILLLIALAGHLPLLSTYHLYADDYPHFAKGPAQWLHVWGVWRIAGMLSIGWLVEHHLYGVTAIVLHALTAWLLFLIALRALASLRYALVVAVLFEAFPWSYQSFDWAACACFVFATFFCLLIVESLMTGTPAGAGSSARLWRWPVAVAGLAFAGLLFNEATFFAVCAAGGVVATRRDWQGRKEQWLLALSPLAGAAVWAVVYKLFEPAHPFKQIAAINPRALLSPIYYQYANLEVFDVWRLAALRDFAFSTIGDERIAVAFAISVVLVPLIWWVSRQGNYASLTTPAIDPGRFAVFAVVMLLASAAIYVLGGGYSLDARKRYLIVLLLILASAAVARWLWLRLAGRLSVPAGRAIAGAAVVVLAVFGSATSLMMNAVWHHELARLDALFTVLAKDPPLGPITLAWNPYLHDLWPHSARSWGSRIDEDWVLDLASEYRGLPKVVAVAKGGRPVRWDKAQARWIVGPR